MMYLPHEQLRIDWNDAGDSFNLTLPWVTMEIDVTPEDKGWIREASDNLHMNPTNPSVQKFIQELNEYPISYRQPRSMADFTEKELQESPLLPGIDCATPRALVSSFGCQIDESLKQDILPAWTWDREKILAKSLIQGTNLYDPLSFISYLICYRLEWESTTWSGQDGLGQFLEKLLREDESKFFRAIGWVSRQSWYVTMESCKAMEPALTHFKPAKEWILHFMNDEAGHYKFMDMVFSDIGLDRESFEVGNATRWMLAAHGRTATISPLAFSAMINLFEAAYYEGQDPISRVILLSSKPEAARGFDLHYKINQEHRHCDMPLRLAACLAPQTREHAVLTLGIFELTLNFLDVMEQNLNANSF